MQSCTLINNNDNNIVVITHWCPSTLKARLDFHHEPPCLRATTPPPASFRPPATLPPPGHQHANGSRAAEEKNISDTTFSQDAHYLMGGGVRRVVAIKLKNKFRDLVPMQRGRRTARTRRVINIILIQLDRISKQEIDVFVFFPRTASV